MNIYENCLFIVFAKYNGYKTDLLDYVVPFINESVLSDKISEVEEKMIKLEALRLYKEMLKAYSESDIVGDFIDFYCLFSNDENNSDLPF